MTTTSATIATTNRPITFGHKGDPTNRTLVTEIKTFNVGTLVEVRKIRDNGTCTARVMGYLFEQEVHVSDLVIP